MKRPETLTDIHRVVRFFIYKKNAFGSRVDRQFYGYAPSKFVGINLLRLEEDLSQAQLRLSRVNVENLPWQDIFKKYDRKETLFFCDPPYWQTDAGYAVDFPIGNYHQLAEFARTIKGKIIITLNDCKEMLEIFAEFNIKTVEIKYTLSRKKSKKFSK